MATESGVVTKIASHGARTAWVQTVPSSACESCSSRHQCSTKSGSQEREVEVINDVGARAGDRIQLAINTGSLLKATFLLYIFPVLCMLVGGIAGHALALQVRWDPSVLAAIMAIAFLTGAMMVVRFGGNRMARKAAYRPRIIRIIDRATDASIAPGHDKPAIPTA